MYTDAALKHARKSTRLSAGVAVICAGAPQQSARLDFTYTIARRLRQRVAYMTSIWAKQSGVRVGCVEYYMHIHAPEFEGASPIRGGTTPSFPSPSLVPPSRARTRNQRLARLGGGHDEPRRADGPAPRLVASFIVLAQSIPRPQRQPLRKRVRATCSASTRGSICGTV
ncbi:hypothetical protein MTO96_009454 [Rhipicephalus appendiculatus]